MNGNLTQIDVMAKGLEASLARHRVISQNLANVNTPGYQAREVRFEDQLAWTLVSGNGGLEQVEPQVVPAGGGAVRADGNNVDIDHELGRLGKNAMTYQTITQVMASQLGMLRAAIQGR